MWFLQTYSACKFFHTSCIFSMSPRNSHRSILPRENVFIGSSVYMLESQINGQQKCSSFSKHVIPNVKVVTYAEPVFNCRLSSMAGNYFVGLNLKENTFVKC